MRIGAGLALLLIGICGDAVAQPGSAIEGVVADATGAVLPRAQVTLSVVSGITRTGGSNDKGEYAFRALPAGTYEILASASGFDRVRRTIELPPNTTLVADFRLPLASVRSDVHVTAASKPSPIVDVRSASAPFTLTHTLLSNLPTDRSLVDTIALAPGVSPTIAPGTGYFGNIAFGGAQAANGFVVDGINLTDPDRGGAWVTFNYNWVDTVQVAALGAPAEYGRTTGATVDAVLRSGTNRYSGLFDYWTTQSGWTADNTANVSFTPADTRSRWDADLQAGGPVVRDRAWFFAGVERYHNESRPAGLSGPDYTVDRDTRGIIKVNLALASNTMVESLFERGHQDVENDELNAFLPTAATDHTVQTDAVWSTALKWTPDDRTAVDVHAHGYDSPLAHESMLPGGNAGPAPHVDQLTGIYSVNTADLSQSARRAISIGGSAARFVDGGVGHHDLRFGADFERSTGATFKGYPGNQLYYDLGTSPDMVELWNGDTLHFTSHQLALYARDRWTVSRVTVDGGVRIDVNRGSVPASGTVFRTDPISPRMGIAWDVNADHKTVVRAHWGRYADPLYGSQFSYLDRTAVSPDVFANVIAPDQFVPFSTGVSTATETFAIAPTLRQPHVTEVLVGIDREIASDAAVAVQYIGRRFRDSIGVVETQGAWAPVPRIDPGPDGVLGTADDGGPLIVYQLLNPSPASGRSYLVTNPGNAFRDYDALQISGRKRYSHNWELLGGFTWARVYGTVSSGGAFSNALLDHYDLGFFGAFVDPNHLVNKAAPSTSSELKLEGIYHLPWLGGTTVSSIVRIESGPPWRRTASFSGLGPPREIVIMEPVVTQYLPAQQVVDLRIEKTAQIRRSSVGFFVDIFNTTNQGIATGLNALSGSYLGTPTGWTMPRTMRLGSRISF